MTIFRISPLLFFFIGISPFICLQFAIIILKKAGSKAIPFKHFVLRWIFIIYILTMLSLSLFPVQYAPSISTSYYSPQISLIPFQNMFKYSSINFLKIATANLLVLMPLGYLLPILNSHFKKFSACIYTALAVSLIIKILQYIEIYYYLNVSHTIDIGCAVLNLVGACYGYFIWRRFYIKRTYKINSKGR